MHRAVGVRQRPGLLAPSRGRQHDVGEPRGLGEEEVLHDDQQLPAREDRADASEVGQRDRGVRRRDPQELDRALLGVAPDLHRVGRRRPVRDRVEVDVPELRELAHVLLVVPVAKARQIAVGAGLARVLRARLPVHLIDPGARAADHPAQQVQVVDLAGGRRGLVGLVEALQDGRQQPLARAEHLGGRTQASGRDVADLADAPRRVARDGRAQLVEA